MFVSFLIVQSKFWLKFLMNHVSEVIHIWTIGTVESLLCLYKFAAREVLEVNI